MEKFTPFKFEGNNFGDWKVEVIAYLRVKKLWGIVSGSVKRPSDKLEVIDFEALDSQALGILTLSLGSKFRLPLKGCSNSHEAWLAIINCYEGKTAKNFNQKCNQLFSVSLNDDIHHLLTEIDTLSNDLNEMGCHGVKVDDIQCSCSSKAQVEEAKIALKNIFNDAIKTAILLRATKGTAYETIGNVLTVRDETSWDKVKNIFINEKESLNSSGESALITKSVSCTVCNRPGHSKERCWSKKVCDNCGKLGHLARFCRSSNNNTKTENNNKNNECYSSWILDSAATNHMAGSKSVLTNISHSLNKKKIYVGNGNSLQSNMIGDAKITSMLQLVNSLFVPGLQANLVSVAKLTHDNYSILFKGNKAYVLTEDLELVAHFVKNNNNLYILGNDTVKENDSELAMLTTEEFDLWHKRLGHVNEKDLLFTLKESGLKPVRNLKISFCESCALGKATRCNIPKERTQVVTEPLELVHSDVCGPFKTKSRGGNKYFVTFLDDFSNYTYTYFMKNKSEVFEKYHLFKSLIENNIGRSIRTLRSDNGGEYVSHRLKESLAQHGVMHETSAPYSPFQNGKAERMNRTLVETARTMLIESGLPKYFWAEAVDTATYLRNRISTSKKQSPLFLLTGKHPSTKLHVFGCEAFVFLETHQSKMEPKAVKGYMVGYVSNSKDTYKIWIPRTDKIVHSRNVKFNDLKMYESCADRDLSDEDVFEYDLELTDKRVYLKSTEIPVVMVDSEKENTQVEGQTPPQVEEPTPHLVEEVDDDDDEENVEVGEAIFNQNEQAVEVAAIQNAPEVGTVRRSGRITAKPDYYDPCAFIVNVNAIDGYDFDSLKEFAYIHSLGSAPLPTTINEAKISNEWNHWKNAIASELDSLNRNSTWEVVKRPEDKTVIDTKWVFNKKFHPDGTVSRFKARLVARGFMQRQGIDYKETFAPIAKMSSLRMIIALACKNNWELDQIDFVTAFLNGTLEDDVYIYAPYGVKCQKDCVLKLRKSLYGLKQAPREWNKVLDETLIKMGFKRCLSDHGVYFRKKGDNIIIIGLWVDDVTITGNNALEIQSFKSELGEQFEMKDLGQMSNFIGIQITRDREVGTLKLHQPLYIMTLLEKFGMKDCKPANTPLPAGFENVLKEECNDQSTSEPYRELLGGLMYLMVATRPDIAYSVGLMSRFSSNPKVIHWEGLKHILRYLQGTSNMGIVYSIKGDSKPHYYSDSNYCTDDKSTNGYVGILAGGAISWASKKQQNMAKSSTEAEYMGLTFAAQDALWLRQLFIELELGNHTIKVFGDNQGSLKMIDNPVNHNRTKHIEVCYHFIRDYKKKSYINTVYCPTTDMIADALTKSLNSTKQAKFRSSMGVM